MNLKWSMTTLIPIQELNALFGSIKATFTHVTKLRSQQHVRGIRTQVPRTNVCEEIGKKGEHLADRANSRASAIGGSNGLGDMMRQGRQSVPRKNSTRATSGRSRAVLLPKSFFQKILPESRRNGAKERSRSRKTTRTCPRFAFTALAPVMTFQWRNGTALQGS